VAHTYLDFLEILPEHPFIKSALSIYVSDKSTQRADLKNRADIFWAEFLNLLSEPQEFPPYFLFGLMSPVFLKRWNSGIRSRADFSSEDLQDAALSVINRITTIDLSTRPNPQEHTESYANSPFELKNGDLVRSWAEASNGYVISYKKNQIFGRDDRIFTIGSCFALEIKAALKRKGFLVSPDYLELKFDISKVVFGGMPLRDTVNHYDTYSIRAEYERAQGKNLTSEQDIFQSKSKLPCNLMQKDTVYTNPHRFELYGATIEDLLDASQQIDRLVTTSIRNAKVHIITLGLIETWRNPNTLKPYIVRPKKIVDAPLEACLTGFTENFENMRAVIDIIRSFGDDRQIILSVSPVPLKSTVTSDDIVVANMRSKSTLRTVAAEIDKLYDYVHYIPSYEFVTKHNAYLEDGRRVPRQAVNAIIDMAVDRFAS